VLLVPLLLLAVVEGGLRLVGFGYNPHFWVRHSAEPPGTWVENQRFSYRFFPPALARRPQPLQVTPQRPSGVYRIVVLGESAAEGDPAYEFGFGRILQVLLAARHPNLRFEVVNVAFTAINSHVIRPIARDCAKLESDCWIVYMGNNEVIGPYGPGTVFSEQTLPLPLIRAAITLKGLRLGQLADALSQRIRPSADAAQGWGGMTMFARRQFRSDDPRLLPVYDNFRQNLDDILLSGRRANARVLLSTVAGNHRDWAPLASVLRPDLTAEQRAAWDTAYQAGVGAEKAGDYPRAIREFEQAARIDDGFADLQFRWARCCLAAGQRDAARIHFAQARDCDALRFRTDSRLNASIRNAARDGASAGVKLVDAEQRFAAATTDGIPGAEWFHEHVHFTFAGNYLLARMFAEEIDQAMPSGSAARNVTPSPWLPESDCAARLGYTAGLQYEIVETVRRRLLEPVYQGQTDVAERTRRLDRRLAELRAQDKPAARQRALQLCRQAVAAAPDDWVLHSLLARSLAATDDLKSAADEWRQVVQLIPHHAKGYFELGQIALKQNQPEEALAQFQRAVAVNPDHARAHEALALTCAQRGQNNDAVRHARQALTLDPTRTEAAALLSRLTPKSGR
jgi:tetratricopeptide (TPR) repeat protein